MRVADGLVGFKGLKILCILIIGTKLEAGFATGTYTRRKSNFQEGVVFRLLTIGFPNSESVALEALQPKSVRAGKSVTLLCTLVEGKGATFSWTRGGLLLRDSDRLEITNSRKTSLIRIDSVDSTDSGLYTCIASGNGSEDRTSAHLTVEGENRRTRNCIFKFDLRYTFENVLGQCEVVNGQTELSGLTKELFETHKISNFIFVSRYRPRFV